MIDYKKFCYEGTTIDDKRRVHGDLIVSKDSIYIHPRSNTFHVKNGLSKLLTLHEVIPESVCLIPCPATPSNDDLKRNVEQILEDIANTPKVSKTPLKTSKKGVKKSSRNIKKGIGRNGEKDIYKTMSINNTVLSNSTKKTLVNNEINTIDDLLKNSPKDLLRIKGVGEKKIIEISEYLKQLGLELKED